MFSTLSSTVPSSSCFSRPHAYRLIVSRRGSADKVRVSCHRPSFLARVLWPSQLKKSHHECCASTEPGACSNSMMVRRSSCSGEPLSIA